MEDVDETNILEQFKKNDETFRNTMERIFQKYSNLDDSGPDVCLKTMTFTSGEGSVPLNSATAEKKLQHLRVQLKNRSLHALDSAQEEHTLSDQDATSCKMEVSMADLDQFRQMENGTASLWCGSKTSQRSLESMSSSYSCLWNEPSQPEEEDQDLERTLSSNGSTLLDVYPNMLNQIGKAYRRQYVTNVASTVLRRYRRRRWQSYQAQHRGHNLDNNCNGTLNRTRERAHAALKPAPNKIANHQKSTLVYQRSSPHKSKIDFSPLKSTSHTSHVSTACYSPRREDMKKKMEVENRLVCWPDERLSSKSPRHRPVRVLDLSTPPLSGSTSPRFSSPDLNQTYVIEPVSLPRSCRVPHSSVSGANQTSFSYPKQAFPVIRTSEVCRSPYKAQRYSSPSSYQENPTNQLKHQRSFSNLYHPSSSVSRMPSQRIDAEFMRLYHHFICRKTNPTSSCHLCKRRSGVQSPAVSSTSMSALSLTPIRSRMKKRHREPEVVESLRFKRFRDSCSPQRTSQFWPNHQQQETHNSYVNSAMTDPNEDKYTRNRALLLQCPSPGFLRAIRQSGSGSNGRRLGSRLDLQTQHCSPLWKESLRCRGAGQGGSFDVPEGTRSPVRTWDQSGVSLSPRLSRRRLLLSDF